MGTLQHLKEVQMSEINLWYQNLIVHWEVHTASKNTLWSEIDAMHLLYVQLIWVILLPSSFLGEVVLQETYAN